MPFYGDIAAPPAVAVWHDIELNGRQACLGRVRGPMKLAVVLASKFEGPTSFNDIAARIGAISASKDLLYWSTTEQRWRTLITESFALDDPNSGRRRPDFTVQDILSGRTLYFGQIDTRSTGLNVYSLSARSMAPGRLILEIINLTPIKFAFLTLFEPQTLRSVHIFDRLAGNVWGYYGISTVRSGAVDGHEKSFINRASAIYRYLIGVAPNGAPPLAP